VSSRLTQKYRRFTQLYQERGLLQVLCHIARAALSVLYSRQVQYITLNK